MKDQKLSCLEESKDTMDSFISRFEKYAIAKELEEGRWVINLSALLKGFALEVYDGLSNRDANDYPKRKKA